MKKRTTKTRLRIVTSGKKSGRTKGMQRPARLAIAAAVGVIAALMVFAVIAKAARPYLISHGENKEIAAIKQQISEAETENRKLKSDIRHIQTPEGMESEARKLGYIKPGEYAVIFEEPKEEEEKESSKDLIQPQNLGERLRTLFSQNKPRQ